MDNNSLFGDLDEFTLWKKEWVDMPEFIQEDEKALARIEIHFMHKRIDGLPDMKFGTYQILIVNFNLIEDINDFANLLNLHGINCETKSFCYCESREHFSNLIKQKISKDTRSIWFPKDSKDKPSKFLWVGKYIIPRYPFYIISKGRWDVGTTRKAFDRLKIPYHIVVEEQEFEKYASFIPKSSLLVLPKKYLNEYDVFNKIGDGNSCGPGAARNYCWDHSISVGAKRHWVFDDNVSGFCRLNKNRKIQVNDASMFRAMEDFVDRYTNIAISGPNYRFFAPERDALPPYSMNTRIYSMLLIDNNIPYRWRGRYNEDTDLSLRVLKDGWCTVQFYAFLGDKLGTQTMKGGNTEEFYIKEGTLNKSQMLVDMHPDIAKLVWRYERWHHEVDYSIFKKNKLLRKKNLILSEETNNYDMELKRVSI